MTLLTYFWTPLRLGEIVSVILIRLRERKGSENCCEANRKRINFIEILMKIWWSWLFLRYGGCGVPMTTVLFTLD